MSMHMVGYETLASLAALTAITPIPDGTLRVAGNDVFVPKGMNNISFATAMINSSAATLRAQIQAPSLRATLNYDIGPINNGLTFMAGSSAQLPRSMRLFSNPVPLVENEPLDVFFQNGGAAMCRAFIMLSDGPVKPVSGRVYTVRCTTGVTLATALWVNGALTFGQTLPSGRYQLVGCRVWGANLVAARVFFVGGPWRPGLPACTTEDVDSWPDFRWGNIGVWGEFDNIVPPSFDFMGVTDTAQVVFLDLIKIQ